MLYTSLMIPAILVSNVHKRYSGVHAVNGVDLAIRQGEFLGLLGPNGAGKSTLINIIAGLTRADSGAVSVMGHDVVADYREARKRLGVVPQELVFDAFFTVREVLRIQSGYFGFGAENEGWIDRLLTELKLSDKANANMRTLSGGMKRRVLIAQALVHKPDVIVLDEPTAGVDIEVRRLLWDFISRLHAEGHTIVLTTHYLEEAESLCDRIAILNHGRIIALDTKQALLDSELGRTLKIRIVAAAPVGDLPEEFRDMVIRRQDHILELALDKRTDSIARVLSQLQQAGVEIVDLQTERADLEDVFVRVAYTNPPGSPP